MTCCHWFENPFNPTLLYESLNPIRCYCSYSFCLIPINPNNNIYMKKTQHCLNILPWRRKDSSISCKLFYKMGKRSVTKKGYMDIGLLIQMNFHGVKVDTKLDASFRVSSLHYSFAIRPSILMDSVLILQTTHEYDSTTTNEIRLDCVSLSNN